MIKMVPRIVITFALLALAGCGWMGKSVVDQAAGFPASNVITDVKATSDEYEQEKHEERVEELSKEYEEFLRSRDKAGTAEEAAERSVIIRQEYEGDSNN